MKITTTANLCGLALATAMATASSAEAQDRVRHSAQVRVACTVGDGGGLQDCSVVSRLPEDDRYDDAALRAASQSVARLANGEAVTGRIHFPVRLETEADYEARRAGPPEPPSIAPPPSLAPATIPAGPQDTSVRAWAGLDCVVRPDMELRRCHEDRRDAPSGVLAGGVQRVVLADTVAGRLTALPAALPALPAQVRADWLPHGERWGRSLYSHDYARPAAAGRVVWVANLFPPSGRTGFVGSYDLREYDCTGRKVRILLTADAGEAGLRRWSTTEPGDWTMRSALQGDVAALYDHFCPAGGQGAGAA